eukprot:7201508-Ditylum_brightwellii.AAC.1
MGTFGAFVDPMCTVPEWLQSQLSVQPHFSKKIYGFACFVIMHQDEKSSTNSSLGTSRLSESFHMCAHRPPMNTWLKTLQQIPGRREIIDESVKVLYVYRNSAP